MAKPNRSTVDMRFLSRIWEAFLLWCREQFEAKVGVRVLGMGEFCYRRDTIGNLEFINPMFVVAESFARGHGLHDRRSKTHAIEAESVDIDLARISTLATELIGEPVTKDVVENALRDVVDRIGEVCGDPDRYGVVTLDFGFAKLFSENKSLEFLFGETKPKGGSGAPSAAPGRKPTGTLPPLPRPGTSASAASTDFSISGSAYMDQVPGMAKLKRELDAPLQRPHRPHARPAKHIQPLSKDDLLSSHGKQLAEKAASMEELRDEEHAAHVETLHRLKGEVMLDKSQQSLRRKMNQIIAEQQQQQKEEKRERDVVGRQVAGIDFWPFRTEAEVQQAVANTNAVQKAMLDAQLAERRERRKYMELEMQKQQLQQQEVARQELALLEAERRGGRQPPLPTTTATPAHSVERALDDAFSRYETYLNRRKATVEHSASFLREQRYLSEQAETLKYEEQRRRTAEMRSYLERQMADKKEARTTAKKEAVRDDNLREGMVIATLPVEYGMDEADEAHLKLALKQTLDGQVEMKARRKQAEQAADLEQQQHTLTMVAAEMAEKRTRDFVNRQEEKVRQLESSQGAAHRARGQRIAHRFSSLSCPSSTPVPIPCADPVC